jgi:hypothetical protein
MVNDKLTAWWQATGNTRRTQRVHLFFRYRFLNVRRISWRSGEPRNRFSVYKMPHSDFQWASNGPATKHFADLKSGKQKSGAAKATPQKSRSDSSSQCGHCESSTPTLNSKDHPQSILRHCNQCRDTPTSQKRFQQARTRHHRPEQDR